MTFVLIFVGILVSMFVGACISSTIIFDDPEEFNLQYKDSREAQEEMNFTYCDQKQIIEAFPVSKGTIPGWAMNDNIEIAVAPKMKVTVHYPDGTSLVATDKDYLMLIDEGELRVCTAEEFESRYQPVILY